MRHLDSARLKVMSTTRRETAMETLVSATRRPPNGEISRLDERIVAFERRHGMDSKTLLLRLAKGEIAETIDICAWLIDLKLRERLEHLLLEARPR